MIVLTFCYNRRCDCSETSGVAIWGESRRSKGPNEWLLYYTYTFVLFFPYLIKVILGLEWLYDASFQALSLVRRLIGTYRYAGSYSGPRQSSGISGWWSSMEQVLLSALVCPLLHVIPPLLLIFCQVLGAVGKDTNRLCLSSNYVHIMQIILNCLIIMIVTASNIKHNV